jgi:uncharacterized membrane protein YedE/YeeE
MWGGLALGVIFGAIANRTNFCTMGAISDVVNMEHWGRARMWLLAITVGAIGTQWLQWSEAVDLSKSIYLRPSLPLLSLVVGGLVFGVGMTMAGGCANRNLVRLGAGSVRSLVVLVFMAIAAYMTLKGLFGQWRATFLDPVSVDLASRGLKDQSLGSALAALGGLEARTAAYLALGLPTLAALVFVFKDKRFRANGWQLGGGLVLGTLVVAGWYLTGHIGYAENPETLEMTYFATNTRTLESMSFVAPTAFSLELLMLWTDKSLHASFGIASAAGVVLGSMVYALAAGKFRWEGFASMQDLRNQLVGAVLMGFGGVTALGCTVGQGMSGMSTLALGSMVALLAIVAGATATLKLILWRESLSD